MGEQRQLEDVASRPTRGCTRRGTELKRLHHGLILEKEPTIIRLPVGASHSVAHGLTELLWSLSSRDVDAPTEPWKLGAWGQYEVGVTMRRHPRRVGDYSYVDCRKVRVRIPRE